MRKTNYNEIKVAAARTALFNNINDVLEEINIHDVLKLSSGENLPTHKMIDGNYPVFGGGGETGLTHNIFNVDFETLAIGRVGARCGCVFKVPKKSWVTDNALYALSFDKRFLLDYLIHYLSYVDLNQYANRAAQPVISLKRISSINFPLIDIERQKAFIEIIKKVENGETHFGEEYSELNNALKSVDSINELQDELSCQLTQLENLNQAILQEAVQGKLVPQDKNDEPASELLKRIQAEKAKSGKKEKPLPPIKPEEIPFEIPENWVWCRLGEITQFVSGNNFESTDFYKGDGVKCIKITNAGVNEIIETDDVLPFEFLEKYKQFLVFEGDLVLALTRPYISTGLKISICPKSYDKSLLNQRVAVIRALEEVSSQYVYRFLSSNIVLKKYKSMFEGQGQQPNLKKEDVTTLLFPLSPLSEQKRIVAEIEKQFAKTKQLSEHITANQQATEQLLKALLHQAFEVKEVETV